MSRERDQTGLMYYRARYYRPDMGRFIAEDPIGLAGGLNTYAYVYGNPISYIDPLGLQSRVSMGVSGKAQVGIPQLGFLGGGVGGGLSFGINVPKNWRNLRCYQLFAEVNANATAGIGVYGGIGLSGGVSRSSGVMRGIETTTGMIADANVGWGVSGGVSMTAPGRITNPSDLMNPIEGLSGGGGTGWRRLWSGCWRWAIHVNYTCDSNDWEWM